jgi:hypothetical protein
MPSSNLHTPYTSSATSTISNTDPEPIKDKQSKYKYLLGIATLAAAGGGAYWLTRPSNKDPQLSNGDIIRSAAVIKAADLRLSMKGQPFVDIPAKRVGGSGRVAVPKIALNEREILANGFLPSKVAIPERGQEMVTTFRHPKSNLHIHKHPKHWFIHKDKHTPISMSLVKGELTPETTIEGTSHILTEGVPGLVAYIKNWLPWRDTMEEQIEKQKNPLQSGKESKAI